MSALQASLCVGARRGRSCAGARRAAPHCAAAAPPGELPPTQQLHLPGRRAALAAAAATLVLAPSSLRGAHAASSSGGDDAAEEWTRYTRAFRERFETSISSATRAYTFEYPASWTPGALRPRGGGARRAPALRAAAAWHNIQMCEG